MSVKAKIAAGAATLTLVGGGLGMAGTLTASAATPSCGATCTSIFPQKYSNNAATAGAQYEVDVYQAKAAANQPVILFQRSDTDKALDFVVRDMGLVSTYYDANTSSESDFTTAFEANYGGDTAYEFQYEPDGQNSDMCLSTWPGEAPQAGYKVRLERCGQYVNSMWVADAANVVADVASTSASFKPAGDDVPLINGADDSYSDPLVMNYPAGNPTNMPRPILNVQPEASYSTGATYDNQEFGGVAGVNP